MLTGINLIVRSGSFPATVSGGIIRVGATSANRSTISSTLSNNGTLTQVAANYSPVFQAGLFNYAITFDTPFSYNPAAGNLLIEIFQPNSIGVDLRTATSTQSATAYNSTTFGNFAGPSGAPALSLSLMYPPLKFRPPTAFCPSAGSGSPYWRPGGALRRQPGPTESRPRREHADDQWPAGGRRSEEQCPVSDTLGPERRRKRRSRLVCIRPARSQNCPHRSSAAG